MPAMHLPSVGGTGLPSKTVLEIPQLRHFETTSYATSEALTWGGSGFGPNLPM